MQFKTAIVAILAAGSAMAHMNLKDPAPLAYKNNPYTQEAHKDYSLTSPISGAQYPCKGYLKFIGTPDGTPVATYSPGQSATFTVEGGASHNGGSCQLSLSYDKGATFTVIKSFIGSCPTSSGGTFGFTIPSDAPEGNDVVFAWTWVNKTGNREFYMSCAIVNIKTGGGKRAIETNEKRTVAFADRPQVFKANLGGDDKYCTKEGVDTVFPEPGPDVETNASNPGPAILCATGKSAPTGGSGSNSGSGSSSSSSASSSVNSSSSPSSSATSVSSASSSVSASSSGSSTLSSSSASARDPVVSSTTAITPTGGVYLLSSSGTATSTNTTKATSAPPSSSAPAATPTASTPRPAPTGGATGGMSGACSPEGAWNCIDGKSFQRCASGRWSPVQAMAAGTTCQPGVGNNLNMSRLRARARRDGYGGRRLW
ncbi:lytic polysaccharide monooxygenase [Xylaria intraflava]|nr:lytic polysaccharide monooxygenase [Xylaria intraflava]